MGAADKPARSAPRPFTHWKPGRVDALRVFLLSESFQGAVQLTCGLLFVSLFVLVDALRFPGACVAVLLYIVVSVVAAPDNNVGTRIFLCGFMIGPMWIALITGGLVGTFAKLAPTPLGHLLILATLGPLVLIPFAANRVGVGHPFLWAMGMVSALYVGLPIVAGWPFQDVQQFWTRSVALVFLAALIAMFAGSVLSMVVLPSLASHKLEDEVSLALRSLGHHLTSVASHLLRREGGGGALLPLPGHMQGMHPLLLGPRDVPGSALVPGLVDKEALGLFNANEVYVALMDWFEHMSRPPEDAAARSKSLASCLAARRSSGSFSSTRAKSTFYGADPASQAAAVAAAVIDAADDWDGLGDSDGALLFGLSKDGGGEGEAEGEGGHGGSQGWRHTRAASQPRGLRLGSSAAATSTIAARAKAAASAPPAPRPAPRGGSVAGDRLAEAAGAVSPAPSIADVRQLLAHSNQLLDAAATEPQWLRGCSRRFDRAAWAKVIAAGQLLALRLSALDLVQRDHAALLDESPDFPVMPEYEALVQGLYASAAAALALVARQLADRDDAGAECVAMRDVLQREEWRGARERHADLVEAALIRYWRIIHDATPEAPVTLPRAHWVRRWMFFQLATRGVADAVDGLVEAAAAAVAGPRACRHCGCCGLPGGGAQAPARAKQDGATSNKATDIDVEAGRAAAGLNGSPGPANGAPPLTHKAGDPVQGPRAAAEAGPSRAERAAAALQGFARRHTAWLRPWLPLALNVEQYRSLRKTFGTDLPAALSSKQAFLRQIKGRRFIAGVKYWFVISTVLVALLLVQYHIPSAYRRAFLPPSSAGAYAPNFGYSAAAVGMADRVEATVFKVVIWVGSAVVGAAVGWALMSHAALAENALALAAVICAVAFCVGCLGRSRNTLVTLYTLMTIASVVLCQFTPCCTGHTGSTTMAIVRGGAVAAAALWAVAVQNLVFPWYTSAWALEQLAAVYKEAADLLADLVVELYEETDALTRREAAPGAGAGGGGEAEGDGSGQAAGGGGEAAGAVGTASGRVLMLNEAVRRMQRQLAERAAHERGPGASGAAPRPPPSSANDSEAPPPQQPREHGVRFAAAATAAASDDGGGSVRAAPEGGGLSYYPAAGPAAASNLERLAAVKVSLVLDTTAWTTGIFATPPVVLRMLSAMFDVVDALGALQQAIKVPVEALSGSWDWTLNNTGQLWGQLLLEVIALADATTAHVTQPTPETAQRLLGKIQDVQHSRYEYFERGRDLRQLMHAAVATDDALYAAHMDAQAAAWHLPGHLRYTGCVYATAKVLDRITTVARCALEARG
ncbi:hypothetical protein MNEG_7079 [Monoraphidium neglectum]|uniref:Uncharacterized protein n=1 Tax=Monoraphidium neglectum TaxID=145388 RepID=A0A0D2L0C3_9CHLO|nr:hypothetical protein MNEG_7079 [Monoraphidium neglectum]KIZ00884.1 hypothetical protein MNEG_7079 [Monoraphidium neglectum]|eukprot:XP_013899903.1 hypothetical protein MNEG_7079 [Monoraphidium neglectum]